jgi:murein DD-endopeptidase MepM/ murein hydrolase activator NlpD
MRRVPILAVVSVMAVVAVAACMPLPPPEGASYSIQCPVTGRVSFTNDWHAPRAGGLLHEGNDVFAPSGTPNVAVVSGVASWRVGARSGKAVWLDGDDGNEYFYAHFTEWNGSERRVVAGEVIGFTGMTGDAAGTSPHTHFEIHPAGADGDAVNPYPSLVAACTNRAGVSAASAPDDDLSSAADDGLER